MNIKRSPKRSSALSITPLVDIVFLLLLFFALTLHFSPEEVIQVDLPTAQASERNKDAYITILIAENRYYLQNEPIDKELLADRLLDLKHTSGIDQVQVKADKKTELEYVVFIIDVLQRVGFKDFDLATQGKNAS